jgi:hypothetical protein
MTGTTARRRLVFGATLLTLLHFCAAYATQPAGSSPIAPGQAANVVPPAGDGPDRVVYGWYLGPPVRPGVEADLLSLVPFEFGGLIWTTFSDEVGAFTPSSMPGGGS